MRCTACSTVIAHHAKFCPKCGKAAAAGDSLTLPRAAGALPSTAPIPRVGKVFLATLVVGVGLVVAGVLGRQFAMVVAGLSVLGVLAVVSVVGHHVS